MTARQQVATAATKHGWSKLHRPSETSSLVRFERGVEQLSVWFTRTGTVAAFTATNGTGVIVRGGNTTGNKLTRVLELIEA
ncbi:hypothetical protein [Rhodococcus phage REQ1]|uniref:hypothetical protein n=1 Tax=Rhodococcus phage REQ1 TaxID=1109712 RepID=UPI00023EEBF4|nr:hypothetical protein RoPhREQ1_gp19 [Rhodococcus phage REQ1]AEV52015.1 hypothetical protein [Rhodococcus phage REQ1]